MTEAFWYPDAIDARSGMVRLCQTGRAAIAAAAFLDERWDRTGLPVRQERIDALRPAGQPVPMVFIWHSAFCCSTLLARCLDRPGANFSLKEPAALMEVANIKRMQGEAAAQGWLQRLLPVLGQAPAGEGHVTIKPTNTVNNLIGDVMRLLPDSRHLFLTSNLKAFLVSIAKKGESGRSFARRLFTIFAMDGHPVAKMDQRQLLQMSDLQIAAIVWHMQVASMLAGLKADDASRTASLDGDRFVKRPAEALAAVDGFFGLELGSEVTAEVASGPLFRRDAKDASQAYGPGRRAKDADKIAKSLGPELDAIIEWSYSLFPASPRDGILPRALIT